MDYKKVASDILDNVGGKENIKSLTHCFTRLRLVLKDSKKADKATVSRLEGVIQVVEAGGQFQVVLGNKVNKVYDAAIAIMGGEVGGDDSAPAEKQSFGNLLIQKLGEIFTPLVPAIAAAGLIKGFFCQKTVRLYMVFEGCQSIINKKGLTFLIIFTRIAPVHQKRTAICALITEVMQYW